MYWVPYPADGRRGAAVVGEVCEAGIVCVAVAEDYEGGEVGEIPLLLSIGRIVRPGSAVRVIGWVSENADSKGRE